VAISNANVSEQNHFQRNIAARNICRKLQTTFLHKINITARQKGLTLPSAFHSHSSKSQKWSKYNTSLYYEIKYNFSPET